LNGTIPEKRNISNEQTALDDALSVLETNGLTQQHNGLNKNNSNNNNNQGTVDTSSVVFLSGLNEPNIDDLTVFGVLRSIEGLPAHTRVLYERTSNNNNNNPNNNATKSPLLGWYQRMTVKVGRQA
jgi:hypothetical protein